MCSVDLIKELFSEVAFSPSFPDLGFCSGGIEVFYASDRKDLSCSTGLEESSCFVGRRHLAVKVIEEAARICCSIGIIHKADGGNRTHNPGFTKAVLYR